MATHWRANWGNHVIDVRKSGWLSPFALALNGEEVDSAHPNQHGGTALHGQIKSGARAHIVTCEYRPWMFRGYWQVFVDGEKVLTERVR